METYKVVRMYQNPEESSHVIKSGLTLEEAQEHCRDPETSSSTCTQAQHRRRTKTHGPWFDGYTAER